MTGRRGRQGWEAHAVSALFDDPARVDAALRALVHAGLPRDLVDVVVTEEAARRFYPGRARPLGRDAIRYAGAGGLIGLIVGATLSLAIIALPGLAAPGLTAIVQLLGPNLATVSGAVVGALIGLLTRRRAEPRHARVVEAPASIVMVVTVRTEEEADRVSRLLVENGGRDPRREV